MRRVYPRTVSHPAPDLNADLAAIVPGEVWENPVTGEQAKLIEDALVTKLNGDHPAE